MEKKMECSVVRDLMPNYIEHLTEDKTNLTIEEHLSNCSDCKLIYDQMTNEVTKKVSCEEITEEKKAKKFLEDAKLGNAVGKFFKVSGIITIILYLILNIFIAYMIISNTKYLSFTDKRSIQAMIVVGVITILIPGIPTLFLFIKKSNNVVKVIKGVLQILLLIGIPYIYIIGAFASMAVPSSTTNSDNYMKVEESVEEKLNEEEFEMLPDVLPQNISDIEYSYHYAVIFSDNCLDLDISYTYLNLEDFENEKIKMQTYNPVNNQIKEDEFQMYYVIGNDIDEEQNFRFGYNEDEKRVTYRISYDWN